MSIDVILPFYNNEETLACAIQSILTQTHRDFRLLLMDDGSTDGSYRIAHDFERQDHRITLLRNAENQGIVACLNKMLGLSEAQFVARMDGDDISYPDRLASQLVFLQENPDHAACSGSSDLLTYEGNPDGEIISSNRPSDAGAYPVRHHFLLHPFLMARREAMLSTGGYRPVHLCEDADLYYRLIHSGMLHNLAQKLGAYRKIRQHPDNLHKWRIESLNSQLCALLASDSQSDFRAPLSEWYASNLGAYRSASTSFPDLLSTLGKTFRFSTSTEHALMVRAACKYLKILRSNHADPNRSDIDFIARLTLHQKNSVRQTFALLRCIGSSGLADRFRSQKLPMFPLLILANVLAAVDDVKRKMKSLNRKPLPDGPVAFKNPTSSACFSSHS